VLLAVRDIGGICGPEDKRSRYAFAAIRRHRRPEDKHRALGLRRGRAAARLIRIRGIAPASDLATTASDTIVVLAGPFLLDLPIRSAHPGGEAERSHAKPALPIRDVIAAGESQTHGEKKMAWGMVS